MLPSSVVGSGRLGPQPRPPLLPRGTVVGPLSARCPWPRFSPPASNPADRLFSPPQDSHKLFFCYKIASNSTQRELLSEASWDSSPCLLPPLLPSPAARSPSGAVFIPLSSLIGNVCEREGTYVREQGLLRLLPFSFSSAG